MANGFKSMSVSDVHPARKPDAMLVMFLKGVKLMDLRPEHPERNPTGMFEMFAKGDTSIAVRPEHPSKNLGGISLKLSGSWLAFSSFRPVHPERKALGSATSAERGDRLITSRPEHP